MITGEIKGFDGEISTPEIHRVLYTYNLERLPGWSSVREHLDTTTPSTSRSKIDPLVASFGLGVCMNAHFGQLSLGQQNRTNLARYMLQDFDLLIMDESLANVDEVTKEKIILEIKALFPMRSFLYISHNVVEVAKFCKEILVLRGHHKTPQTVSIRGRDDLDATVSNRKDLERIMLEIINAV
jgi:ABC-type nitrate/sulfonate/bicarbonate transport system ATPase subunit